MIPRPRTHWWQSGAPLGILGLFTVLAAALTVESAILGSKELTQTSAYDSAGICTSTANVDNCRFQGTARIVRTWTDKRGPSVEVAFDQLGGRKVSSDLDPNTPSEWQRWQPEDEVNAELWRGLLTVVDGTRTLANPDNYQGTGISVTAWIAGPATVALSIAYVWLWVQWRRGRRALASRLAVETEGHPVSTQQLPLTPAMTAFLQTEAGFANRPLPVALVCLGIAAVIPAIFSVVSAVQGVRFTLPVLFLWAVFLALGAALAVALLYDSWQERRDLVADVFNRATGSFPIHLNHGKYTTYVQVVVGGRKLSSETVPQLQPMESFTGSVDYLPVSGDLLEVRDESGSVVWSKFGAPSQSRQVDPVKV